MSYPPYVTGSSDDRWVRGTRRGDLVAALRGALHRPDPTTSTGGDPDLPPAAGNTYFGSPIEDDDAEELFLEAEEGEHPAEPTGDDDDLTSEADPPHDPGSPPPPPLLSRGTGIHSNLWRLVKRELDVKVYSVLIDRVFNFGTTTEVWQTLGSTATPNPATGPAQGYAVNQRVGSRICLLRVHVRGYWYTYYDDPSSGLGTGDQLLRWGVALNQAPTQAGSTTAISPSDFFDSAAGGVANLLDDETLWRKQQYCTLVDETFRSVDPNPNSIGLASDPSLVPFEADLTINQMVDFEEHGYACTVAPVVFFGTRASPSNPVSGVKMLVYHYFSDC